VPEVIILAESCGHDCQLCLDKLCMQKIPVFSNLSRSDLEQIAARIVHLAYPKGSVIMLAGARADSITIINTGKLKACRYAEDGKEQIVYLFTEGDFFGEHGLFNDQVTPYQVEALTDVKLCHLYRSDFQAVLQDHPSIALQIIAVLSSRLASLEKVFGNQDLDARINTLLLEFADKYGRSQAGGIFVRLPLSREGIANYLGIARETLSRKLSQLESDGIIRSIGNKTIQIIKPDALRHSLGTA
jgi:CRP/FNR family transcriptional regulator